MGSGPLEPRRILEEAMPWLEELASLLGGHVEPGEATLRSAVYCGPGLGTTLCVANSIVQPRGVRPEALTGIARALERLGLEPVAVTVDGILARGRPPFYQALMRAALRLEEQVGGAGFAGVEARVTGKGLLSPSVLMGSCIGPSPTRDVLAYAAIRVASAVGEAPCCAAAVRTGGVRIYPSPGEAPASMECAWLQYSPGDPPAPGAPSPCPGGERVEGSDIVEHRPQTLDPGLVLPGPVTSVLLPGWIAGDTGPLWPDTIERALRSVGLAVERLDTVAPGGEAGVAALIVGGDSVVLVAYDPGGVSLVRVVAPRPRIPWIVKKLVLGLALELRGEEAYRALLRGLEGAPGVDEIVDAARRFLAMRDRSG